jgi:hypothetical protein
VHILKQETDETKKCFYSRPGLPDVFKIPIWVNFGGPYVDWKMLIYFMAIWNILQTFVIFYDHWVHFVFIWYRLPRKIWQPCSWHIGAKHF